MKNTTRRKNTWKRGLGALLVCMALLAGLVPLTALAEQEATPAAYTGEGDGQQTPPETQEEGPDGEALAADMEPEETNEGPQTQDEEPAQPGTELPTEPAEGGQPEAQQEALPPAVPAMQAAGAGAAFAPTSEETTPVTPHVVKEVGSADALVQAVAAAQQDEITEIRLTASFTHNAVVAIPGGVHILLTSDGGGHTITSASFALNGGELTWENVVLNTNSSPGVGVNGGIFAMNDGRISASGLFGVEINTGIFTMSGGEITGASKAAIKVNAGDFIMYDGSLHANTIGIFANEDTNVTVYNGSIAHNDYGTAISGKFEMFGGLIFNSKVGFELYPQGLLILNGGSIDNNSIGLHSYGGHIIFKDGSISDNLSHGVHFTTWGSRTFQMDGGRISSNGGYGVYNNGVVEFTMDGGKISGNRSGGVYYAPDTGTFIMKDGEISGNTAANGKGGGVYMNGGEFTMNGGTISGNMLTGGSQYDRGGGGVYLQNGATFTMNGGEISGHHLGTASSIGGGVWAQESNFTMNGGKITNNSAEEAGGVAVYENAAGTSGAEFVLNGGEISNNTATQGGGVVTTCKTILLDGKISGNSASSGGGGLLTGGHNEGVVMSGGEISNNSAVRGGGVRLIAANFTMSGGKISGNYTTGDAGRGGGVHIWTISTFTMSGGEISDNTAANGGGIYLDSYSYYAKVTFTGGSFSGNTATDGWRAFESSNSTWAELYAAQVEGLTGLSYPSDIHSTNPHFNKAYNNHDINYAGYQVTVQFVADGASFAPQTMWAAGLATAPTLAEREGYRFLGWFAEGSEAAWDFNEPVTESMTLTARWRQTVEVTYMLDGSVHASETIDKGETATAPVLDERDGYRFLGWFAEGSEAAWDFTDPVTESMTLTARWRQTVEVTYMLDGSVHASETIDKGETATAPVPDERDGYRFLGWFAGGSEAAWDFNDPVTESMTLTARWRQTVEVTYMLDGSVHASETIDKGKTATAPVLDERDGYLFLGWFAGGSGTAWDFNDPVTESMTLTARWAKYYRLSFNAAGGTGAPPPQTIAEGFAAEAVAAPTRTGYTFVDWAKADGSYWAFEGDSIDLMPGEDTELTAVWYVNLYGIVYHYNDGSGNKQGDEAAYGSKLAAPASPTRAGHSFTGWAMENNGIWDFAQNTMPAEELHLYAQWEENKKEEPGSNPGEGSSPGGESSTDGGSTGGGESSGPSSSSVPRASSSRPGSSTSSSSSAVSSSVASVVSPGPSPSPSTVATPGPQGGGDGGTAEAADAPSAPERGRIVVDEDGGHGEPGEPDYIQPNGTVQMFGTEIPQGGFSSMGGWSILSLITALLSLLSAVVVAAHTLVKQRQGEHAGKRRLAKWLAAFAGALPLAAFLLLENLRGIPILISRATLPVLVLCGLFVALLAVAGVLQRRKAAPEN